eukprot:gene21483-28459_t
MVTALMHQRSNHPTGQRAIILEAKGNAAFSNKLRTRLKRVFCSSAPEADRSLLIYSERDFSTPREAPPQASVAAAPSPTEVAKLPKPEAAYFSASVHEVSPMPAGRNELPQPVPASIAATRVTDAPSQCLNIELVVDSLCPSLSPSCPARIRQKSPSASVLTNSGYRSCNLGAVQGHMSLMKCGPPVGDIEVVERARCPKFPFQTITVLMEGHPTNCHGIPVGHIPDRRNSTWSSNSVLYKLPPIANDGPYSHGNDLIVDTSGLNIFSVQSSRQSSFNHQMIAGSSNWLLESAPMARLGVCSKELLACKEADSCCTLSDTCLPRLELTSANNQANVLSSLICVDSASTLVTDSEIDTPKPNYDSLTSLSVGLSSCSSTIFACIPNNGSGGSPEKPREGIKGGAHALYPSQAYSNRLMDIDSGMSQKLVKSLSKRSLMPFNHDSAGHDVYAAYATPAAAAEAKFATNCVIPPQHGGGAGGMVVSPYALAREVAPKRQRMRGDGILLPNEELGAALGEDPAIDRILLEAGKQPARAASRTRTWVQANEERSIFTAAHTAHAQKIIDAINAIGNSLAVLSQHGSGEKIPVPRASTGQPVHVWSNSYGKIDPAVRGSTGQASVPLSAGKIHTRGLHRLALSPLPRR